MNKKPTLKDLLNTQRINTPDPPLLSENNIVDILRSAPATNMSNTRFPATTLRSRPSLGTRIALGGIVVACCTVIYVLSTNVPTAIESDLGVRNATIPEQAASTEVHMDRAKEIYDAPPAAPSTASAHVPDTIVFLDASKPELENLRLTVSEKAIVYNENGYRITITTSGIRTRGSRTPTTTITPRHISVYHNESVFATWFQPDDSDVQRLVPVRIYLTDQSNHMFPTATVVLWYDPSPSFYDALSGQHRMIITQSYNQTKDVQPLLPNQTKSKVLSLAGTVYPNPLRGATVTVSIESSAVCETSAHLRDINGREILTLWSNETTHAGKHERTFSPPSELSNGMYLLTVVAHNNQAAFTQRLLIER